MDCRLNHSQKEYVHYHKNGPTFLSTNTAESWFAFLKRSFVGIHHLMSKRHLHRYCNERSFMWNARKLSDGAEWSPLSRAQKVNDWHIVSLILKHCTA